MMWCERCSEAIESVIYHEYDIPDVNVGGYRKDAFEKCPECGSVVFDEPSCCVMCKRPIAPDLNLCESCVSDLRKDISERAEKNNTSEEDVKDGYAELINMED
ncbi:uncharacterized protein with PIN domain [Clostridiales Family XIII bacterium PM5-7]